MTRILRFVAVAALLTALGVALAGVACAKSIEEVAFARARKLADVSAAESKDWPAPSVEIANEPRYFPSSPTDGDRVCGLMDAALVGERPNLRWVVEIRIFVRPTETQLLMDGLTHEYLHVIYFERAMKDPLFYALNPDSEEWVRSLLPTECHD
jgi:hypothetical protein